MRYLLLFCLIAPFTTIAQKHVEADVYSFNAYIDSSKEVIEEAKTAPVYWSQWDDEIAQKAADRGDAYHVVCNIYTWSHGSGNQPYSCYYHDVYAKYFSSKKSMKYYIKNEMNADLRKQVEGKYNFKQ